MSSMEVNINLFLLLYLCFSCHVYSSMFFTSNCLGWFFLNWAEYVLYNNSTLNCIFHYSCLTQD